ncbi:hypothetical protein GE061_006411 [Apolygus lucorum]|uniref:Uncharacterized protein n=1 Tax=Apolygus lucorum TaxID=248454 RepID=A0A8S9WT45_APOLU|nr:hypothetical protein GE061_006411 [Apolygus lucorum]
MVRSLSSQDTCTMEWEPSSMVMPPEILWPWSKWSSIRMIEERKEPHNMMLLMQHAYARCPLTRCCEIRKIPLVIEEDDSPRREFFERRYVRKDYVTRQKKEEKSRFILPRFRNIPARTDSNFRSKKCVKAAEIV